MNKIVVLFLAFLMVLTVGCSKPVQDDKTDDDKDHSLEQGQNQDQTPDDEQAQTAKGRVTQTTTSDSGLVSFKITTDTKDEYLMNVQTEPTSKPMLGDIVTVTVDGDIAETSPMQATARDITVDKEFAGVLQTTDIYSVSGISAEKLDEDVKISGWTFKSFANYDECQTYLEDNDLTSEFERIVADMDISSLTDQFFSSNDLYMFICNSNASATEKLKSVYVQDDIIFLKLSETTTSAGLIGSTYDVYLVPLTKGTSISDGMVLKETVLSNDVSTPDTDEGITDTPQDDTEGQDTNNEGSVQDDTEQTDGSEATD